MADVAARWRILSGGFDELNLWELLGRHSFIRSDGQSVTPDLPVREAKQALAEALSGGLVVLYDPEDPAYRRADLEEALALIADDREWQAATAERRFCLAITPAGEVASQPLFEEYKRSSPFLGLGVADPQVASDGDVELS